MMDSGRPTPSHCLRIRTYSLALISTILACTHLDAVRDRSLRDNITSIEDLPWSIVTALMIDLDMAGHSIPTFKLAPIPFSSRPHGPLMMLRIM
jgi:hypothetical protein